MLSLFLEALDQTIVGTAMLRIIAELHGLDCYTWVVTAYVLASMTIIPIVGKLSDLFGPGCHLYGHLQRGRRELRGGLASEPRRRSEHQCAL
jgi:MFS family permease